MDKPINLDGYVREIKEAIEKYGKHVPVEVAAKVMDMDKSSLRDWLYSGTCQFGPGIMGESGKYGYTRVLSVPWWFWMTKEYLGKERL